ncbi:MAG: hypothetical protein ABMB14_39885, partial [Myxococcota bacterium]
LVIPVGVFAVLSANVLVAYNGTGAPQTVAMGGWSVTLDPTEYAQTWSIAPWPRQVVTVGPDGAPLESARWARGDAVYNVGRRGVLMSGVAVYSEHGDVPSPDPVLVGNPLLAEVSVDHWFAEPPEQISRRTSRWSYVVDLVRTEPLPGLLGAPAVSETLARAILTWDPPSQPWVDAARALSAIDAEEALRVTAEARDRHGDALFAHLAFQAVRDDADLRAAYDARARELDTAEAWYLAGRVDDPPEARSAYRTALDRDPTFHRPWCGLAWLDAQASQWAEVGPELADCDVTTAAYQRLRLLAWRFDGAEGLPPGVDDPIVSAMVAAEVDPASTLRWTTQLPPSAQPMLFLAAGDLAHASSALAALDPDPAQALRIALSTGAAADAVPDAAALTGLVDAAIPTLADGPDADALIIAAAAAVTGRTEAVAVGESPYAALITSFLAADPRDLAALEQVAEALPPTSHGALYAAAVVRSRADPNPAGVDRARRLSIPGSVPKVW